MVDVVVVSVKNTGNLYFLSPNGLELKKGTEVIIDTENGLLLGVVCKEVYSEKADNLILPLNNVVRIATDSDKKETLKNISDSEDVLSYSKKCGKELELDMNFVDVFYNLDRSQLVISFLSDNRVDFRDLAKKLAQKYKTRIELRQIGVRDKAKRVGGLGPCGLFLCCNSFLTDFNSVSINMAKNQYLALNPSKINGVCGRLLCCLGYENDIYTELKKDLPKINMIADTTLGMGKVVSVDVFKRTYKVDLKEQGIVEFQKDDVENGKNKWCIRIWKFKNISRW